jgi:hypothetical protein
VVFSPGALGFGHGQGTLGLAHAGQGAHNVALSVPCRVVCGAREKGACVLRNVTAVLGVQSMHEQGQSMAGGRSTGSVGGGQGLGNGDGVQEVSWARQQQEACLLCLGPLGHALGPSRVFKRGRARSSSSRHWSTEGVEGCRSGRWLDADWGYRVGVVREGEKREIKARLPRVPPLPYVHRLEDKGNKTER